MGFLVEAIANISPYIYAVCGLLALFQLYRTWQVRAERRQAVFSLERDKALDDLYRIFVSALLMLVVMGFTYFASTTLRAAMIAVESSTGLASTDGSPTSPNESLSALIPTPTFTPEAPTATPRPTRIVASTPVPDNQEEDTQPESSPPAPRLPAVSPALCPDARAVILSPGNGAIVNGVVPIVGTAQHDQFNFYKLELAPGGANQSFSYFDGAGSPVVGGLLGNLNSSGVANGTYTVQLVVVDNTGNYPSPCRVTVIVQN